MMILFNLNSTTLRYDWQIFLADSFSEVSNKQDE